MSVHELAAAVTAAEELDSEEAAAQLGRLLEAKPTNQGGRMTNVTDPKLTPDETIALLKAYGFEEKASCPEPGYRHLHLRGGEPYVQVQTLPDGRGRIDLSTPGGWIAVEGELLGEEG